MSVVRSVSAAKDRAKTAEFLTNLGFEYDKIPIPCACSLNRYAFEMFFDTIRNPEMSGDLTPDHLEHGFKVISDAASIEGLEDVKLVVNHLFMRTFLEIMSVSNRERAEVFARRQGPRTSLSSDILEVMAKIGQNETDGFPPIFEHVLGPREFNFSSDFLEKIDKFVDENTAPAVRYLLRPFFTDSPHGQGTLLHPSRVVTRPIAEVWGRPAQSCKYVEEVAIAMPDPHPQPFAGFQVCRDVPILRIVRPKAIVPQLPTVVSQEVPKFAEYTAMAKDVHCYAFSCDSMVYYVDVNGTVRDLRPHQHAVSAIAVSDDGKCVASSDIRGNVKLHSLETGDARDFECARDIVTACAFSKGVPSLLAIGTMNGGVMLYDVSRGEIVRVFLGHTAGIVTVEMHANWAFLASASCDGTVRVWALAHPSCVRLLKAAGAVPTAMRWSNSGKLILTAANDGMVAVSDVGIGATVKHFRASEQGITLADFTMNDEMIVCHDKLGNFIMWEVRDSYCNHIATTRIDRIRLISLNCFGNSEVRVLGCPKQ